MANRNPVQIFPIVSLFLISCGCATVSKQTTFRQSLLPAAPQSAMAAALMLDPPSTPANLYVADAPVAIVPRTLPPPPADARWREPLGRAESRFARGKRKYQARDFEGARTDFNAAIDFLLEASERHSGDRRELDKRFEEMTEAIYRYDVSGLGAGLVDEEAQFQKAPLEDILEMTFPVDPRLKNQVREQVAATSSQLPLTVNDSVLGYIHYFSGRGKRTLVYGLQRAGKYRPMIQRILDEEGVPQELLHLAQAESGFLPRAVSRASAKGMWQFMSWRGNEYGLMQSRYHDDRLDPEKATRAAARHLRDLYQQFGDWYLAIAAYNCGPGVVERAVERTGYADFFELRARRVLPAETTNYVPIILAMTIMTKNARYYEIEDVVPDGALEYDTVEIASPVSLELIADLTETPLAELVALNPALLKNIAPAGYLLHTPRGAADTLRASLQLVPEEKRTAWRVHRVGPGDTLADIGRRFSLSPSAIAAANTLEPSAAPVEGDHLLIPMAPVREKDNPAMRASAKKRTSSRTAAAKRKPAPAKTTASKAPAKPKASSTLARSTKRSKSKL